jgi:diguanylate cyclase (GGDEF)-like protein
VVLISLGWNVKHTQEVHTHFLLDTARLIFNHVTLAREWIANHGGVYAPVTEKSQPNHYLKVENRDIVINDKTTLTLINPAYMTRQLAELAEKSNGIQLHITSLNPIRPENGPTELERKALLAFETQEVDEFSQLLGGGKNERFFYMAPLKTTHACLRCHSKQGFQEGDMNGGISVTIPDIHPAAIQGIVLGHAVISILGLLMIILLSRQLADSYKKVHLQSIIDVLTGIPNRRYFLERLEIEYRRASRSRIPLTLLICDVDHFKQYNDALGHVEGDKCLVKVSNSMNKALQRGGDLLARFGGEEFVIILPNTDLQGGINVARHIQTELKATAIPHPNSPVTKQITMSIGVATEFNDYPSQEKLIKRADDALYRAKHLGRNRIEYDTQTTEQIHAAKSPSVV